MPCCGGWQRIRLDGWCVHGSLFRSRYKRSRTCNFGYEDYEAHEEHETHEDYATLEVYAGCEVYELYGFYEDYEGYEDYVGLEVYTHHEGYESYVECEGYDPCAEGGARIARCSRDICFSCVSNKTGILQPLKARCEPRLAPCVRDNLIIFVISEHGQLIHRSIANAWSTRLSDALFFKRLRRRGFCFFDMLFYFV